MIEHSATYLEVEIDGRMRQLPLVGDGIFRIGRADTNDVPLNNDLVSRNHAMVQGSGFGLFYITDCGSRNGTFVNDGRATSPVILRPGDRIQIGTYEFTFHQDVVVKPPPATAAEKQQSTSVMFAWSPITVLVVDIRDFTGLTQRLEAPKLLQVTGTLFRLAGRLLQDRGAWAQKYIGDAVMAVWRHKKQGADARELAAILDGLDRMFGIANDLQRQFGLNEPIRIGAGINSGGALIGNMGSLAFSDYTAWGDVVNKAFRLESATKELGCDLVLGQETYQLLASSIESARFFQRRVVKLKGYDEPATVFSGHFSVLPGVIEDLGRDPNRC
jgi:adenylate cyclase